LICLSFDTDHLDDERMREFVSEVAIPGAATFFCTRPYSALDSGTHELCPHPTLEPADDWSAELDAMAADFPDARGVRTHSCIQSHMLSMDFKRRGYEWISAGDQLGRRGLTPYREVWGLWHVPIYYMDNMDFSAQDYWPDAPEPFDRGTLEATVKDEGVYVIDFHPVHLLLNSASAEAYLSRRDRFLAGESLDQLRCDGYGARSYYEDLVELMGGRGVKSTGISDALDRFKAAAA
jgi:hypothetical protein